MAERNAPVDPAVDELKRRARRRLVGAIVLALAAAVLLPMLLEKEPRPLGEDITVKIPAVDDGKFVNRLATPDASKAAVAESPAASNPADSSTAPAAPVASPAGATAAPVPAAPASQASAAPAGSRARLSEAEQRVLAAGPPSASGKAEPRESRTAAPAAKENPAERPQETRPAAKGGSSREPAKAAAGDGFVVQLAAFSDDKGANALASKLKRQGYHAYTEAVQTSRGTLYRVRVGGYASREAAGEARNRLKGEGYSGIVAPAH